MNVHRPRRLRTVVMVVAVALLAPLVTVVTATTAAAPAQAANSALFNPGYIISDALFYNGDAMSASDVQGFLASKEGTCSGSPVCLKNYTQPTPTMPADSLCPGTYVGSGSERAADIIAKVGKACNISQRVLLVTLQKEQSLVTATSPSSYAYLHATGFSCPDSRPCDPAFFGFFYQVYYAAHQFQNYAAHPTSFNYIAGRNNTILYSPVCTGTQTVFIQNKATAGLYDYTPYVPFGGPGCTSNGNLNFWSLFTDWFGPTTGTSLYRTIASASVYLVAGNMKYPISSGAIFAALGPLGPVGYVSQAFLDSLTTGSTASRMIRDPGGTVYFYDAGIKLPFTSCDQVADYGGSCSSYMQLTQVQADAFFSGPALTNVLGTVEGARYYVKGGVKAEILDDASQQAAGIPAGMDVLTENAVADLPTTTPIVRDGVFVQARGTADVSLLSNGSRYAVPTGDGPGIGADTRTAGALWPASLAKLATSPTPMTGLVSTAAGTAVLGSDGRHAVSGGVSAPASLTAVPVSDAFLQGYPDAGALAPGSFIKSPSKADVYVVMPDNIRPIAGWGALLALTPDGNPHITVLSQSYISSLNLGPTALTAGTLVRSPGNATVYYIDGVTDRIALSSFEFTNEAGITSFTYATDALINAYPMNQKLMSFGFSCGTDRYVAAGGSVHLVSPSLLPSYALDYVPLDQFSCVQLHKGIPATAFIRTQDGSIYQLDGTQKHPITSMARFAELSGGQPWINVVPRFANYYTTGAPA